MLILPYPGVTCYNLSTKRVVAYEGMKASIVIRSKNEERFAGDSKLFVIQNDGSLSVVFLMMK